MKPVLFIDFDRTLFDTSQFYDWLGEERFLRILELTGGHIAPPDFAAYLYADAIPFLKHMRETYRIVILTFAMNTELQRKKIRGSGILSFADDVIITSGARDGLTGKGEAIREYIARIGDSGWEHIFVDDAPKNIDEVKRMHPEIRCVEIRRSPEDAERKDYVHADDVVLSLAALQTLIG